MFRAIKTLALLILFPVSSSAEIHSENRGFFEGYLAESIILHGEIIYSAPLLDNLDKTQIPQAAWYHVRLSAEQLAKAIIEGKQHLEGISYGVYICSVRINFPKDSVYYECLTHVE